MNKHKKKKLKNPFIHHPSRKKSNLKQLNVKKGRPPANKVKRSKNRNKDNKKKKKKHTSNNNNNIGTSDNNNNNIGVIKLSKLKSLQNKISSHEEEEEEEVNNQSNSPTQPLYTDEEYTPSPIPQSMMEEIYDKEKYKSILRRELAKKTEHLKKLEEEMRKRTPDFNPKLEQRKGKLPKISLEGMQSFPWNAVSPHEKNPTDFKFNGNVKSTVKEIGGAGCFKRFRFDQMTEDEKRKVMEKQIKQRRLREELAAQIEEKKKQKNVDTLTNVSSIQKMRNINHIKQKQSHVNMNLNMNNYNNNNNGLGSKKMEQQKVYVANKNIGDIGDNEVKEDPDSFWGKSFGEYDRKRKLMEAKFKEEQKNNLNNNNNNAYMKQFPALGINKNSHGQSNVNINISMSGNNNNDSNGHHDGRSGFVEKKIRIPRIPSIHSKRENTFNSNPGLVEGMMNAGNNNNGNALREKFLKREVVGWNKNMRRKQENDENEEDDGWVSKYKLLNLDLSRKDRKKLEVFIDNQINHAKEEFKKEKTIMEQVVENLIKQVKEKEKIIEKLEQKRECDEENVDEDNKRKMKRKLSDEGEVISKGKKKKEDDNNNNNNAKKRKVGIGISKHKSKINAKRLKPIINNKKRNRSKKKGLGNNGKKKIKSGKKNNNNNNGMVMVVNSEKRTNNNNDDDEENEEEVFSSKTPSKENLQNEDEEGSENEIEEDNSEIINDMGDFLEGESYFIPVNN